ncbi:MAG: hypothetical protein Q4F24_17620 [Eubacteriales bacterium]|nr:hypothetical protein [Eubacteriales bacterium]
MIENYLYHISFYVEEFYRSLSCIYNVDYFQANLYGGDNKILRIQYYRHHSWNLLTYLGMIKDGVDKINKIEVCKDILDFNYDKSTRNFIAHIYEKMNRINETTGVLHGFNVIIAKEDEFLRDIKEPVFNLDLLLKEITMITIDRERLLIRGRMWKLSVWKKSFRTSRLLQNLQSLT